VRRVRRVAITALVLLLALASGRASASSDSAAGGRLRVDATASGISVRAHEAPRGEVLRALASEVAVEVRGDVLVDDRITLSLDDATLPDALRRVLGTQSFLVHYGADGSPGTVEILGAGEAVRFAPPPAAAEDLEGTPGNAPGLPGTRRRYPIAGPLAGAMGTDEASFDDLLGFAARTGDRQLQRAAVERGLGILESEPELKTSLHSVVQQSPPSVLARYLVAAAGPGAEGLAGTIVTAVGAAPGGKGDAVLRELRALKPR